MHCTVFGTALTPPRCEIFSRGFDTSYSREYKIGRDYQYETAHLGITVHYVESAHRTFNEDNVQY